MNETNPNKNLDTNKSSQHLIDEEDDFFERLDRMRGITDEQLLEKEKKLEETSVNIQQEVTKVFEKMSDTDQDLFSRTQMIHFDRKEPIETQVMKAINLQKQNENRHKKVYKIIISLMIIGIVMSILGIGINFFIKSQKSNSSTSEVTNPYAVPEDAQPISINASTIPNEAFREYVSKNFDTDQNNELSPEERNAVIVISIQGDSRLNDIQGSNLFPLIQSISITNCPLETIDLSQNEKLQNLDLSNTSITTLDLSKNQLLTNITLNNLTLNEVILPAPSSIKDITSTDTNIACDKSSEGYYTSCKVQ